MVTDDDENIMLQRLIDHSSDDVGSPRSNYRRRLLPLQKGGVYLVERTTGVDACDTSRAVAPTVLD